MHHWHMPIYKPKNNSFYIQKNTPKSNHRYNGQDRILYSFPYMFLYM